MPLTRKAHHATHQDISPLEWEKHQRLRGCIALIVSEIRQHNAAKKKEEGHQRSRAGRSACKAVDAAAGTYPHE